MATSHLVIYIQDVRLAMQLRALVSLKQCTMVFKLLYKRSVQEIESNGTREVIYTCSYSSIIGQMVHMFTATLQCVFY